MRLFSISSRVILRPSDDEDKSQPWTLKNSKIRKVTSFFYSLFNVHDFKNLSCSLKYCSFPLESLRIRLVKKVIPLQVLIYFGLLAKR